MNKKISAVAALVGGVLLSAAASSVFADAATIAAGEKIYTRQRCETCHGANLQGSATFPNLLTSPKTADKAAFSQIVLEGKSAMPAFKANKVVADGIDSLYDYVVSKKAK
jgi:mono/diheme cytochrome c family protein